MKYLYKGMKGIYNGISVVPGNVYEMNNPNPKLFELVLEKQIKEEIKQIEPKKELDVYSIMERINGIGPKTATEISEEYNSLDKIKEDIENGSFSVGGMSEKKINLIKKELNINGNTG